MASYVKKGWLMLGIVGLLCASIIAAPPPESEKITATDLAKYSVMFHGKVVRVSFNRMEFVFKEADAVFSGVLCSQSKSDGMHIHPDPGIRITFPAEGYGALSPFILQEREGHADLKNLTAANNGDVYVLMDGSAIKALGDRYKEGVYEWSKKTVFPDVANAKIVSGSDLFLFPELLNGKILQLEFYSVRKLTRRTDNQTEIRILSNTASHFGLLVDVPPEGLEFFEEAIDQSQTELQANSIFVKVEAAIGGEVTVKALGRRQVGKGEEATYKW